MKFRSLLSLATAALSFALLPQAALADTLTIGTQTVGITGGTLTVSGTFSNTSGSLEYLNGDNFQVGITGSSLDDTLYYSGAPTVLSGASLTEQLFTLTLPSGLAVGSYSAFFLVAGGGTTSASNTLATSNFTVNVTPEPSTWLLLGTGVLGMGLVLRRRNTLDLGSSAV